MRPATPLDPVAYFGASAVSAFACFPLWKAAAIGQSGFALHGSSHFQRYMEAIKPPWRGCLNVVCGMACARAAIFFGSDWGRLHLHGLGYGTAVASTAPPIVISAFVQVVNQPFTRASITLQDPECSIGRNARLPSLEVIRHLLASRGVRALWLGTSVALLKTVPKYTTAILIKDVLEQRLEPARSDDRLAALWRSGKKSVVAGVAGAGLTNPMDVLRNEMFRTGGPLLATLRRLHRTEGFGWCARGCARNLVSVSVPLASTIFLTDVFTSWRA